MLLKALLYITDILLIAGWAMHHTKHYVYPCYLEGIEHTPFWPLEVGISSLLLYILLITATEFVLYFINQLTSLNYGSLVYKLKTVACDILWLAFDALALIFAYKLVCPLMSGITQLPSVFIYGGLAYGIASVGYVLLDKYSLLHIRGLVLGFMFLQCLYSLNPKVILFLPEPMRYPYLIGGMLCVLTVYLDAKSHTALRRYTAIFLYIILNLGLFYPKLTGIIASTV